MLGSTLENTTLRLSWQGLATRKKTGNDEETPKLRLHIVHGQ